MTDSHPRRFLSATQERGVALKSSKRLYRSGALVDGARELCTWARTSILELPRVSHKASNIGKAGCEAAASENVSALHSAFDGPPVEKEEELLQIFDAVSPLIGGHPAPIEAFKQYRTMRRALNDAELIEAEVKLSRKHKLASMALAQDWSGLPSYLVEGILIWRARATQRSGFLLLRLSFWRPQQTCDVMPHIQSREPILVEPKLMSLAALRFSLQKRGVTIVRDKPGTVIRTGSLGLDAALQVGGFPRGRIIEIFGKESSGKTTLALTTAANVQRGGEAVAYLDEEHKLDFPWARAQGLIVDDVLIIRGTKAKDTLHSILDLIRSRHFALVVVDTLAALVPDEDLEGSHGAFTGEIGQLLARTLPRIASAASKTNTCVLLLNQIRHNHEEIFGSRKVTPGGHALAHYSSIRLELARVMCQKRGQDVVGCRVKATVIKNCVGAPWRTAEWSINFERGLDLEIELVEEGLSRGLISRHTAALTYGGERLGTNDEAAHTFLVQNSNVAALLESELREKLKSLRAAGGR